MTAPPTPPQPVLPYRRREPIKVRAYGVIPLTRAVYVRLQIAVFIVGLIWIAWFTFASPAWLTRNPIGTWFVPALAVALIAEGIETVLMLRRFAQREKEE